MATSADLVPYFWHDNVIHALRLDLGHPEANDWSSELVLDIDHIVSWPACAPDTRTLQFWIAPATLTFHHAGDLYIALDCGGGGSNSISPKPD